LDEVDKLLSTHFMPVTESLFDLMPKKKQVLMFSATYPKETTMKFSEKHLKDPVKINLMTKNNLTLTGLT